METKEQIARCIDHTLLKADATISDIEKLCGEAREYSFASVCVNPSFVPVCASLLADTEVNVCTVVGFPLGATSTEAKAAETVQAIRDGAREIDMVLNIGRLKSGDHNFVRSDISAVVRAAHSSGAIVKVIIETVLLSEAEKVTACEAAVASGADYVKTSTGFGPGGASVADIRLMRKVVGPDIGVKASGGIRTREDAEAMLAAGATRIGASASVNIVRGEGKTVSNY